MAPILRAQRGGVYVGVGPDQNFSYIALARPEIAFLVDIRRGNLLLHLLFRAVFEESRNRLEYLSLLLGRQPPADLAEWDERSIDRITAYIDSAPAAAPTRCWHLHLPATLRRQICASSGLAPVLGVAPTASTSPSHSAD